MESTIALITGGSRGLGTDMALALARNGTDIILTYLKNADDAEEVVRQIEQLGQSAAAVQLDVANSKSFEAFIDTIRQLLQSKFASTQINYLINNAGIGIRKSLAERLKKILIHWLMCTSKRHSS